MAGESDPLLQPWFSPETRAFFIRLNQNNNCSLRPKNTLKYYFPVVWDEMEQCRNILSGVVNILVGEFGHPVWLPTWKSLQPDLFSWPAVISFVRPHSKDWSPLDWRSPSFVAFSASLPPSFTLATSHFDQSRERMRMKRVKFWTGLVSVNSDDVILVYDIMMMSSWSMTSWWCHGTTMIIRIA